MCVGEPAEEPNYTDYPGEACNVAINQCIENGGIPLVEETYGMVIPWGSSGDVASCSVTGCVFPPAPEGEGGESDGGGSEEEPG